jgi:hypothetical protein
MAEIVILNPLSIGYISGQAINNQNVGWVEA